MKRRTKRTSKVRHLVHAIAKLPPEEKAKLDRGINAMFQEWDSRALVSLLEHNLFQCQMEWPEALQDVLQKIGEHGSPFAAKVHTLPG